MKKNTIVKAAAVQISHVLYSQQGTVEKVVSKIRELGKAIVVMIVWMASIATISCHSAPAPKTGNAPASGGAQWSGIKRTDLQRNDLDLPNREVIQARIDIKPGVVAPRHSHPGEEIIYVIEGVLEYQIDGKPPVTLTTGEVLFVPAGAIHKAKNVGKVNAAELATYIVQKGKPLLVTAR